MLPPNTTALIQPMDMGIIFSLKARTKKTYYQKLIDYNLTSPHRFDDPVQEFMRSYTIRDAIVDMVDAFSADSKML